MSKISGRLRRGKLLAASALLVLTIPAGAQLKVSDISVFQLPEMNQQQMRATLPIVGLFQAKKYSEAEEKLRTLIEKFPQWPVHHYNLGAALARQGKKEEALDSLERAITLGFSNRPTLTRDKDYAMFHKEPRFIELVSRTGTALAGKPNLFRRRTTPAPIIEGTARVEPENTQWVARANALVSRFDLKNLNVPKRVRAGDERVSQFLNQWYERGESAGNVGDLYDNRDRGHSELVDGAFPQVTAVEYGEAAKSAGVNYGISAPLYFNAITVGNSSTAINHAQFGRSQPRLIMTRPGLLRIASRQYANDHLYIYPEHRDHDPEKGDLFPANTPYMLVSQGSSGSDKPFIEAAFSVLAAFTPETKEFLRENRLVMPTVQKIIRSGMGQVATRNHYMSALAHPSVFEGKDINLEKMVTLAHGLKKEDVPPRIFLTVKKESKPSLGVGYFGPRTHGETLFNSPGAIARVIRSTAQTKKMHISAARTKDPNGHPLKFHWRILRGDPDFVSVKPLDDAEADAEIEVKWHKPGQVPYNRGMKNSRVDIAVFADNGKELSAPAFVTFYFPPNQKRTYDGNGRIAEVHYDPPELQSEPADPAITFKRAWTDKYVYTDKGEFKGWERTQGDKSHKFSRHGARVIEEDDAGRPLRGEVIDYRLKPVKTGLPEVVHVPLGKFVKYSYSGPDDLLGKIKLCADKTCSN